MLVGARDPNRGKAATNALSAAGLKAILVRLDVTELNTIEAACLQSRVAARAYEKFRASAN